MTSLEKDPSFADVSHTSEYKKYVLLSSVYQDRWIGVQAPGLGTEGTDRVTTAIRLASYRGQRVLLYGFYSGNFVYRGNTDELLAALRTLDTEQKRHPSQELAIIGFTSGTDLFPEMWGHTRKDMDPELCRLTEFPLVLNAAFREFPQPYTDCLKVSAYGGWGAVLIDRNGVILKFYHAPLTEKDLDEALVCKDWNGRVRTRPNDPATTESFSSLAGVGWS